MRSFDFVVEHVTKRKIVFRILIDFYLFRTNDKSRHIKNLEIAKGHIHNNISMNALALSFRIGVG